MKVNLGCGTTYKEGYLNVDAFDITVADKQMSATNLQLEDNSVDEMYASQLIEHLGIAGSIYALSECFRALKPQKSLNIETPDLQKSFEIYVNGGREDRKQILPWIYGVDIPGMAHRFCYPDDLLEETLQKIGFTNISKETICNDPYEPTLKVVCEKPVSYLPYQRIATFRKQLIQKNLVNLDDQLTALEQERLIEMFTEAVTTVYQTKELDNIKELVVRGGVQSPAMIQLMIEQLTTIIDRETADDFRNILTFLIDIDFPRCLMHIISQTPGFVGEQNELFSTVYNLGMKSIRKLSQRDNKQTTMRTLQGMSKQTSVDKDILFFSPKLIMLHARCFYGQGIKEFVLCNYKRAQTLLEKALSYYRDDLLMYWNFARLLRMQGKGEQAKTQYQHTLHLTDIFEYGKQNEAIKQAITNEMHSNASELYAKPITAVTNLNQ